MLIRGPQVSAGPYAACRSTMARAASSRSWWAVSRTRWAIGRGAPRPKRLRITRAEHENGRRAGEPGGRITNDGAINPTTGWNEQGEHRGTARGAKMGAPGSGPQVQQLALPVRPELDARREIT